MITIIQVFLDSLMLISLKKSIYYCNIFNNGILNTLSKLVTKHKSKLQGGSYIVNFRRQTDFKMLIIKKKRKEIFVQYILSDMSILESTC